MQAFSKKKIEQRKEWLTNWLENRKEKRAAGLSESFLYAAQTDTISYADFVNKELILFSNMDNERSIPSIVDGLKPGQRKVLYTCFKRNDKRDIKVAQLAGSVAEHSAYHHGEVCVCVCVCGGGGWDLKTVVIYYIYTRRGVVMYMYTITGSCLCVDTCI